MKKVITKGKLKSWKPCKDGYIWWKKNGEITDTKALMLKLVDADRFADAEWLLERIIQTKKEAVQIAIFAAELALPIWEKYNSDDKRPQEAIKAAKNYLKNPCKKTKDKACAAAGVAFAAAAYAAAYAADAARAAHAARAAVYSAAAAHAAIDKQDTWIKIINYAFK